MIRGPLQTAVWQSMAVSLLIYCLLLIGERVVPQFYPQPVEWRILIVLFGVAFVPRAIMVFVDLLPKRKLRRRRKT